MRKQTRRTFLNTVGTGTLASVFIPLRLLSAGDRTKVKITDIKTMIFQGPKGRNYTLVKVESDADLFGIGEAYGSPGLGITDEIHGLKDLFIGKDPLQIERLYTGHSFATYRYTDGSAHAQQRAMSGIEMALWDLAGKILDVPTYKLLGGKFRDRVRLYDHHTPKDYNDKIACQEWAAAAKERANGITIHKLGVQSVTIQ